MKKAIRIVAAVLLVAALAISANAAGFTPSVEQKAAPTVTTDTTAKKVVVTPVSEIDETTAEVKEALETAYKSIETAGTVAEAAPALEEVLKTVAPEVKAEDLIVRDLIHVDAELAEDETITLTFDLNVDKDAVVIPMLFVDGQWVPVDPELVTVNADGTVSVAFTGKIGVVAFVTVKAE